MNVAVIKWAKSFGLALFIFITAGIAACTIALVVDGVILQFSPPEIRPGGDVSQGSFWCKRLLDDRGEYRMFSERCTVGDFLLSRSFALMGYILALLVFLIAPFWVFTDSLSNEEVLLYTLPLYLLLLGLMIFLSRLFHKGSEDIVEQLASGMTKRAWLVALVIIFIFLLIITALDSFLLK